MGMELLTGVNVCYLGLLGFFFFEAGIVYFQGVSTSFGDSERDRSETILKRVEAVS